MGNYMTYEPATQLQSTNMRQYEKKYDTKIYRVQKNYTIQNKMRRADRYSRNGSNRGNGIRTS